MLRRNQTTIPILVLLTVVAALLRFASLDRPSVWGDEAATYGRVGGTYQELLDQLADSSFPPLHYEAEWWIAQGMPYWGSFADPKDSDGPRTFTPTKFLAPDHRAQGAATADHRITLTPFALRFIPALAGTLFVPAIFFLTVQLFGRRVALVAAALACFSAYALVFSRDAKMYMQFWLFVTMHVACALWWVRTRRALPWACWVLCGLVMVGLHGSGFAILLIDALIIFTLPSRSWLGWIHGPGVGLWNAALLPTRAYGVLRRRRGTSDGTGWHRVAVWRRRAWRHFRMPVIIPVILGMLIIASASWGPLGFYSTFSQKIKRVAEQDPKQVDIGELGIGWIEPYNRGRTLPDYLLYTASAYLTGWEWPRHYSPTDTVIVGHPDEPATWKRLNDEAVAQFNGRDFRRASARFVAIVNESERAAPYKENAQRYLEAIQRVDDQAHADPRTLGLLQTATVTLLVLLTFGLVPWRRLFQPAKASSDGMRHEGRLWRPVISQRVLWIGLWLTLIPWAVYTQSINVPLNVLDGVAKIALITPPQVEWPRCPTVKDDASKIAPITPAHLDWPFLPAGMMDVVNELAMAWVTVKSNVVTLWTKSAESLASFRTQWPAAWRTYAAAWTQENLSVSAVVTAVLLATGLLLLVLLKRRAIGVGAMRLGALVVLLFALSAVFAAAPRKIDSDIWLPRYLGLILPAFFVFVAVLIDRQPVLIRWLTIGLFVLVNMGQFSARVWGYADPPTGLMAADVVAAQPKSVIASHPVRPTSRAYTYFGPFFSAEPGGGTLFTPTGRYYLRTLSGVPGNLLQVRFGGFESNLEMRKYADAPAIDSDLKNSPEVQRFVVWTAMPFGELDLSEEIGDRLYGRFRRVSDEVWPVRDHWRWYNRYQVRRRTYERVPPPTTASAAR